MLKRPRQLFLLELPVSRAVDVGHSRAFFRTPGDLEDPGDYGVPVATGEIISRGSH